MNKIFVLVSALLVSNAANANLIDFSGNICSGACVNGSKIAHTYGDIAGQLDVVYNSNLSLPLSDVITDRRFSYWTAYSNLTGVLLEYNNKRLKFFLTLWMVL